MQQTKHDFRCSTYQPGDIVELKYTVKETGTGTYWENCEWGEGLIARVIRFEAPTKSPKNRWGHDGVLLVEPIYGENDLIGPIDRFHPGIRNARRLMIKPTVETYTID